MPRTPIQLLSPADQERRRGLRVMKGVALGALLVMAVLFVVAFVPQKRYPDSGTFGRTQRAAWSVRSPTGSR